MCTAPWNAFFLNSNGNISFGTGSTANLPSAATFLTGPPRIAGAWFDLNTSSRSFASNTFPVQALGFAGVNEFRIRWINVPAFGGEVTGTRNTFSMSLFDDGTGQDENATQALNPANPIGNNSVPFDRQEGPTDLLFETTPSGLGFRPPRADGSGPFRFEYGHMDHRASATQPVIVGYSIGGQAAGAASGINLSEAGRTAVLGGGIEVAVFELFDAGDFDLRTEGNAAADATPAGQPNANREVLDFFGKACQPVPLLLQVSVFGGGSGSVASSPAGIACPGDCQEFYGSSTQVVLTAAASDGSQFGGWSGCDSVAGLVCTVTMTDFRFVAALFTALPPPPPAPLMTTLNQASFSAGQTMVLGVTLTPAVATPVDAYIVLDVPGIGPLSLRLNGTIVPGEVPIATNFVPFAFSGPLFQYTFTGGEPSGAYQFRAFLRHAGTSTVIGSVHTNPFTKVP